MQNDILRIFLSYHFFNFKAKRKEAPQNIFFNVAQNHFVHLLHIPVNPSHFKKKHHHRCPLLSTCSKYIACIYSARLLQQVYESMYIYSIHAAC
jgi:hypothetical protein